MDRTELNLAEIDFLGKHQLLKEGERPTKVAGSDARENQFDAKINLTSMTAI